jgi:hypothetical protein
VVTLWLAAASPALAWPWMIEHHYTGCNECHVDPSGGGMLTSYGRAQGEVLVRMDYGKDASAGGADRFAWGVDLPTGLLVQPELRVGLIPASPARGLLMQADARVGLDTPWVVGAASLGVVSGGADAARLVRADGPVRVVSREWWMGFRFNEEVMVRVGRMNLPFGLRTDEHLRYVRQATGTDTNEDQQVGLSAALRSRRWRSEWMVVLGNPVVSPDAWRERGYAGFVAWGKAGVEVGASSKLTWAEAALDGPGPVTRHAHGLFVRASPVAGLGMFAEADVLLAHHADGVTPGAVVDVALDGEPVRGLHLGAGGELCVAGGATGRGRVNTTWYLAPHTDLRLDAMYGPLRCEPDATAIPAVLLQLHVYL